MFSFIKTMKKKIYKIMKDAIEIIGYTFIVHLFFGACVVFITPFVNWGLDNFPTYIIITIIIGWCIKKWRYLPKEHKE